MLNPYNYARPKRPMNMPVNKTTQRVTNTRKNGYSKADNYLEQKVMSAKPEELTLMLYEGIVRFVKQTKLHNDNKDVEKSSYTNMRAQAIVTELRATLDMTIPISEEFDRLYVYMNERLIEANVNKENEILDEVIDLANEFIDAWKTAMKL